MQYTNFLLDSLPEDHLSTLVSYLTVNDILQLRGTCKYFRDAASKVTTHIWMDRSREAKKFQSEVCTSSGRQLLSFTSRRLLTRSITITTTRMQFLHKVFPLAHTLCIVGLNCRARGVLGEVVNNDENLKHLELLDVLEENSFPSSCDPNHDFRLEKMSKLVVDGRLTNRENPLTRCLLRACPKLMHLHLGGICHLSDYTVKVIILEPLSKTLTSLTLSGCGGLLLPNIQSEVLQSLALTACEDLRQLNEKSFCPSLHTLDLSYCKKLGKAFPDFTTYLNREQLSIAIQRRDALQEKRRCFFGGIVPAVFCPTLRALNLEGCSSIVSIQASLLTTTKAISDKIGPSNTEKLECVNLRSCLALKNVSLCSLMLKELNLTDCKMLQKARISSRFLEKLEALDSPLIEVYLNCPSLQVLSLNLAGCEMLDGKAFCLDCPMYFNWAKGQRRVVPVKDELVPKQINKPTHTSTRWGSSLLPMEDYLIWREYKIRCDSIQNPARVRRARRHIGEARKITFYVNH